MNNTGLKILIADDNDLVCRGMKRALENEGHRCDVAENGRECLKKLSQNVYDLLFLDLVMPEIDGQQVMQSMKSRFPGTDVIVISAQDDEDVIREMIRLGASGYLMKPHRPEAYIEAAARIADQRNSRSTIAGIPTKAQSP
jgi:DNA-binding NtrC family response regulator